MANPNEVTFEGYKALVKDMQDVLARAVKGGQAGKIRFVDANGTQHDYRDVFELKRAIDILQAAADAESTPVQQRGRRMISLVSVK
jgi:hypothetical protein